MIGLITFAYGAPATLDDLPAYYTHIGHGKTPSDEKIAEAKERFRKIGVGDQLGSVTRRQTQALAEALQPYFHAKIKAYSAYKHTPPFVDDTIKKMVEDGVKTIITFPIKPLYSKMGIAYYQKQVQKALQRSGVNLPVIDIDHWHDHPEFVQVLCDRVQTTLNWLPQDAQSETMVLFTAHSQAGRAETHEVYIRQFTELAQSIAGSLSLPSWEIAYRSAGPNAELWLGPDVKDVIRSQAEKGCKGIVTCDLLSVATNIEVLYDIGYDAQELCRELGIEFLRTPLPDDSYDFIMALKTIILEKIAAEHAGLLNKSV